MKTKKHIELDVDFIGSQGQPLSEQEKKVISDFIKKNKSEHKKTRRKKLDKVVDN